MSYDTELIDRIKNKAALMRRDIIEMLGVGHAGHLGGSLSCTDIVACLYFGKLNITPENFHLKNRNRFIMSKGHSVLAQYAALCELGFFGRDELPRTKTLGSILQGHPDRNKTPGIEANTGSLGQGLSIACGMAYAAKMDGIENKIYVLLGDSELAEGQVWEAAMAAANFKLDNIIAIVDYNGMGSVGFNRERFDIDNVRGKFEGFGWEALETDGHNVRSFLASLYACENSNGKPKCVVASTVKGKGLHFAENNPSFHNAALSAEQYFEAAGIFNGETEV